MEQRHDRTKMLIGDEALQILENCRVAVFGLGGVGGYAAEALARSGVGTLDLIDADCVAPSNLNRQLIALESTLGMPKTEAFRQRIADIDPEIKVNVYQVFYLPESRGDVPLENFDYIIDAIDTVAAKLDLAQRAQELGVPIISAMGCGNRLDPSRLRICDISKTYNDPLSKVMRKALKDRGVKKLDVVFSEELPQRFEGSAGPEEKAGGPVGAPERLEISTVLAASNGYSKQATEKRSPASMVFVPACAGLMMASYVIKQLLGR